MEFYNVIMNANIRIGLYILDASGNLGEGSFSTVHSATYCRAPYYKVAIKIDKNPGINSLKHEASILSYLNKQLPAAKFIPTLYWYGIFGHRACLVTPLYKPMTPELFSPGAIIEILNAIHNMQIVHCDIKPDNFMVSLDTNNIVLIDFGLARAISKSATMCEHICGSQRYASYFVYLGHRPCARDDLISAGYMIMEYYGYNFSQIQQSQDYAHAYDSIHNVNNLQRKQQRTLDALLSMYLPDNLGLYFQYLYNNDCCHINYEYLGGLFA